MTFIKTICIHRLKMWNCILYYCFDKKTYAPEDISLWKDNYAESNQVSSRYSPLKLPILTYAMSSIRGPSKLRKHCCKNSCNENGIQSYNFKANVGRLARRGRSSSRQLSHEAINREPLGFNKSNLTPFITLVT